MKEEESLTQELSNLNKSSVNNITQNTSYLCRAVKTNNLDLIENFLKVGADPNGITINGILREVPLTCINFSKKFKDSVNLILRYRGDINQEDILGNTLLTKFCEYVISLEGKVDNTVFSDLSFILGKGINPNGTAFKNPLNILFSSYPDYEESLIKLLLVYMANPTQYMIKFKGNEIPLEFPVIKPSSIDQYVQNILYPDLVSSYCKDSRFDYILSTYFKLNNQNDCSKCITSLLKNKNEYTEELFSKLRGVIRRKKLNVSNEELTIDGTDVNSYSDRELIFLTEQNPKLTFCFHLSEIPMLLQHGKNFYTQKPLEQSFITFLLDYSIVPVKTLGEILKDGLFVYSEKHITTDILLDYLEKYIKSFNVYMDPKKIASFRWRDLIELQNMLYSGDNERIQQHINIYMNARKPNENTVTYQQRILYYTVMYILIFLRNNELKIPFVSNVIDQLRRDTDLRDKIYELFPANRRNEIPFYLAHYSYTNFIKIIPTLIPNQHINFVEKVSILFNEDGRHDIETAWRDLSICFMNY